MTRTSAIAANGVLDFKVALRRARLQRGLSVADAASLCRCSEQQWRNYEDGRSKPTMRRLQAICDALGLELLKTAKAWLREDLNHPDSARLRALLTSIDTRPPSKALANASPATRALLYDAGQLPMDDATALLAFQFIHQLVLYRKGLTQAEPRGRDLRVINLEEDVNELRWESLPGVTLTKQRLVGTSEAGFGFIATIVRIDAGNGAFHQHLEDRYLDAGMEFFSVVRGHGYGIFEHPTLRKWKDYQLKPGTIGFYRGNRGHCYINTSADPLLLYIVSVPLPPQLNPSDDSQMESGEGSAEGVEFRLEEIDQVNLAADLKRIIKEKKELQTVLV